MAQSHKLYIAEATLTQDYGAVWRVASGPSWASVGGSRVLAGGHSGARHLGGNDFDATGATVRAIRESIAHLDSMAQFLEHTEALPLGDVDHVRGGTTRRYF